MFGLTDDFFQLIANYCIAKIIWLPNRTLLPLLPIRKVIADSFQSNSHWIAMGSKDPFLHCKHNYAGQNLTTHRSWSNEKFNVANNALNTSTAISYKKRLHICHTNLLCVHSYFVESSKHRHSVTPAFYLQHKGSVHIFLRLYFCVFTYLGFCV